jgi:hypothetical protein
MASAINRAELPVQRNSMLAPGLIGVVSDLNVILPIRQFDAR